MIQRSKERIKTTGEVFTPFALVEEMVGQLPESVWEATKTFLDPSCGDGNFLVRVVAHKINRGSTIEQALNSTYGVELMEDNCEWAKKRVLITAYLTQFTNELLPELTYDVVNEVLLREDFNAFWMEFEHIVNKNIVCADALTYDYRFGEI